MLRTRLRDMSFSHVRGMSSHFCLFLDIMRQFGGFIQAGGVDALRLGCKGLRVRYTLLVVSQTNGGTTNIRHGEGSDSGAGQVGVAEEMTTTAAGAAAVGGRGRPREEEEEEADEEEEQGGSLVLARTTAELTSRHRHRLQWPLPDSSELLLLGGVCGILFALKSRRQPRSLC